MHDNELTLVELKFVLNSINLGGMVGSSAVSHFDFIANVIVGHLVKLFSNFLENFVAETLLLLEGGE